MRKVFRVREWRIEKDCGELELTVRCTCSTPRTTLPKVIRAAFPGSLAIVSRRGLAGLLAFTQNGERVRVMGNIPSAEALTGLLKLLSEILTVCDDADVSHCQDLYRVPEENLDPDEWPYTEVGMLVYDAKYAQRVPAANELASRLGSTIAAHPALRRADAVSAIPTSGSGRHFDAPALWKSLIAERFDMEDISLWRTRPVLEQKTMKSREEREQNQQGSMDCSGEVRGKTVLVLDDLYMDGGTMKEAVRALRARGAAAVLGLCAVKTATGTQGGVASLLPDPGQAAEGHR